MNNNAIDRKIEAGKGFVQSEVHPVDIKFPRGQVDMTAEQASPAFLNRFPGAERFTLISVRLHEGARVRVDGFGMPYKNPEQPAAEGWRAFYFAIRAPLATIDKEWNDMRLPPPFSYPYGTEHHWPSKNKGAAGLTLYADLLERTKSAEKFRAAYALSSRISSGSTKHPKPYGRFRSPAYLVDRGHGRYYVVVALAREFMDKYGAAWRRLAKDCEVRLLFHDEVEESWDRTIIEYPDDDLRANHLVEAHEVILSAEVPGFMDPSFVPRTFANRRVANGARGAARGFPLDLDDASRRVSSACLYLPDAKPTRVLPYQPSTAELAEREDTMALHRAVMRGQGFYDWMTRPVYTMASASTKVTPMRTARPLPVADFLARADKAYINALFEEVLPSDRGPFHECLRNRTLGIGLIIAPPGFGKTTLMAVAGLAMTPAQSMKRGYRDWVERTAQAVLIDEASNMHRGDLGCVWGNCLLPVFFGGDPRQLPPTVMTGNETDSEGNLYNSLADDSAISPFGLLTHEWVASAGRILERVMQRRPSVRPPPAGKMLPVFVHCEGAVVHIDERTGSKRSRGQSIAALDIATELVHEGVDPVKISILSPYAANVELILQLRKQPNYGLQG
ncbi:predicted protein [Chaetomium globosum CBS 148.51]|uniref:DNA2/NAM7 helicase-like C-terminal domain-containing protein n=1 Tax=Chaetomium globosum (strain ATCC 6205 / CBS 148.51 / DSM 1962 / NBRC 6347 / NRRL 1970) TaxID=306901 RepID=Q2HA76_CHAGB|nr:uncharacterized protein CHGG_02878 [Chaetomium globosum CBS 148.51]EAQ90943.1 predicted protein [Chaetomium globosum CBS 148.51]